VPRRSQRHAWTETRDPQRMEVRDAISGSYVSSSVERSARRGQRCLYARARPGRSQASGGTFRLADIDESKDG
jgi:hypothetical protein